MNSRKVYTLTKKIPKGRVSTYGELAQFLGSKKYSRAVGRIMNQNFNPEVPCQRIVYSNGKIGGFRRGKSEKIKILRKEGIRIKGDKIIDFEKVLFKFK